MIHSMKRSIAMIIAAALVWAGPAVSVAQKSEAQEQPAADLVINGRVLDYTSQPLPQQPGYITLGSTYTYSVRVIEVLSGKEKNRLIKIVGVSDPPIRRDRDIMFYLARREGYYAVQRIEMVDPAGVGAAHQR